MQRFWAILPTVHQSVSLGDLREGIFIMPFLGRECILVRDTVAWWLWHSCFNRRIFWDGPAEAILTWKFWYAWNILRQPEKKTNSQPFLWLASNMWDKYSHSMLDLHCRFPFLGASGWKMGQSLETWVNRHMGVRHVYCVHYLLIKKKNSDFCFFGKFL